MITVLTVFGLCSLFAWSLVGMFLGHAHESHLKELESSAKKGNLADYFSRWSTWKTHAGSHGHALLQALICIIVALIIPQMGFGDMAINILGVLLIVGSIVASIAHWFYFIPLIALGNVLFLIGILMSTVGFIRGL